MKKRLFIMALLLAISGASQATVITTKLTFWACSFGNDESYTFYLPLLGHLAALSGQSNNPLINSVASPVAGTFTALTASTNSVGSGCTPACTRVVTLVKNSVDTSAVCSIPEGGTNCTWTGTVTVARGDLLTLKFSKTGVPNPDSPMTAMVVLNQTATGGRNWPFTA